MQFSALTMATLFAALQAMPLTSPAATFSLGTTFAVSPLSKRANDCGGSTFINQSTAGSPRISDCQMIVHNIAGAGTFPIPAIVVNPILPKLTSNRQLDPRRQGYTSAGLLRQLSIQRPRSGIRHILRW